MKILIGAAMLAAAALSPTLAVAQAAPAPAATPAPAKGYNTTDTEIGTLLANPATKAVIDKHFPGLSSADSIQMASGMTMRQLQQFKPDMFTDKALADTDADLAKVPVK